MSRAAISVAALFVTIHSKPPFAYNCLHPKENTFNLGLTEPTRAKKRGA